jgi:hypothetical protein
LSHLEVGEISCHVGNELSYSGVARLLSSFGEPPRRLLVVARLRCLQPEAAERVCYTPRVAQLPHDRG